MKIGQIQMKVHSDKEKNIAEVEKYLKKMKGENPDVVVLPEMFNCPYDKSLFEEYSEKEGGDYGCRGLFRFLDKEPCAHAGQIAAT